MLRLDTILESERLYTRPWHADDYDALLALLSDPRVVRYIENRPLTPEEVRTRLQFSLDHAVDEYPRFFCLPLILKETQAVIGRVGINPLWNCDDAMDPCEPEMEWIVSPEYWGRGLATEIGQAMLRYGFEMVGFERLLAYAHPENRASLRVMEKLGMAYWMTATLRGQDYRFYQISSN